MKLEKTILDNHQAQIVVEVEPDRLDAARRRAARKLAVRGKIPGFRPGKAPYDVIVRHYGDAAVYEQAVDLLVDELYPEVLKEADINPAAAGMLEKIEGAEAPKFTFKVPLAPEVILGDYHQIRMPYEYTKPGADKLEKALEELRQVYASTKTVEHAVEESNYILVDLKSDKEGFSRQGFATVVRKTNQEEEFPFPGFARSVVGLKAGESKTIQHTFPSDHADASLAGQTVEISAEVKEVRSFTLPELDEQFARMVGPYETVDALKEALAKDLEARGRADYDDEYFAKLVDKVREGSVIKYAPQSLDHEAGHVVDDMRQRLAQQGLDLETYYKMHNTDAARFLEEEAKPVATKRLERSLVLDEIARAEKIKVDNSALDEEFNNTVIDLQTRGVNFNSMRGGKQAQQRVAEALAVQSANRLLTRRTLERLKDIANGSYSPASVDQQEEETKDAMVADGAAEGTDAGKGKHSSASERKSRGAGTKAKSKQSIRKK